MFSKNGITSSEANHICNIAKEEVKTAESLIESQNIMRKVIFLEGNKEVLIQDPNFDRQEMEDLINVKTTFYPLVAYFRQAIKKKDQMLADIQAKQPDFSQISVEVPKKPEIIQMKEEAPPRPELIPLVDESWAINQFSVKEAALYYGAEATAAAIGKQIHNCGRVAILKQQMSECGSEWDNGHLVVKTVNPDMLNAVESLFFTLQKRHRQAEKTLNGFRAKIHQMVKERNDEILAQNEKTLRLYNEAVKEYERKKKEIDDLNERNRQEYRQALNNATRELDRLQQIERTKFEAWQKNEEAKIAALKIEVPNEFKVAFERLQSLG